MAVMAADHAQRTARRVHGAPAVEASATIGYAGFVTRTIAFALDALIVDVVAVAVAAGGGPGVWGLPLARPVAGRANAPGGRGLLVRAIGFFTALRAPHRA